MTRTEAKKYTLEIGRKFFGDKFKDESSEGILRDEKTYSISFWITGYDSINIILSMSDKESDIWVQGPEFHYNKLTKKTIKKALLDTKVFLDNLTEIELYDKKKVWFSGRWTFDSEIYLNQRVFSETALNKWFYEKGTFDGEQEFKNKVKFIKTRTGFNNSYKCYERDSYGHFHFFNVEKNIIKYKVFDPIDYTKAIDIDFLRNKEIEENE